MRIIWLISDGKPGHLNQSLGLCDALQRQHPACQIITLPALGKTQAFTTLLSKHWPMPVEQPPQLVIGAGHRTHLTVLAAGRAFNARTLVLMKPSLPTGLFDLCLIPEHDKPAQRRNIIATRGALNRMRPAEKNPDQGLMLIGGPSKHFGWDNGKMVAQVLQACRQSPARLQWTLTTSRRTPADFLPLLAAQQQPGLTLVPVEDTVPGWLAEQLPSAAQCWVSQDSVSMVYEALSAECATGLLEVPQLAENRIATGVAQLCDSADLTRYRDWQPGRLLSPPQQLFDEASRCARELQQRLAVL